MAEEIKVIRRRQMGSRSYIIMMKIIKKKKTRFRCYKVKAITRQHEKMKMDIWLSYLVMENKKLPE